MDNVFMAEASIQPEKFLFETVFDTPATTSSAGVSEEQLADIRQEAYQAGFNAAQQQSEKQTADALNIISSKLKTFDPDTATIEREAVSLAIITSRKLAGTLLSQKPMAEVEQVILDALSHMPKDIHLIITVNEAVLDDVKAAIEVMPEAQFITGKLIVNGSADMSISDCNIKWAEGEIIRDTAALTQHIDLIISNYLSGSAAGEQYKKALKTSQGQDLGDANPTQDDKHTDV